MGDGPPEFWRTWRRDQGSGAAVADVRKFKFINLVFDQINPAIRLSPPILRIAPRALPANRLIGSAAKRFARDARPLGARGPALRSRIWQPRPEEPRHRGIVRRRQARLGGDRPDICRDESSHT